MDSIIVVVIILQMDFASWSPEVWGRIAVSIILALLAFAFFLGRLTLNISFLKTLCKSIPQMKSDIDTNKKVVDISDKTLDRIDAKIDRMIDKFDKIILNSIAKPSSPIRLNNRGVAILKQSKVANIIAEKYDLIIEQVKSRSPKNAYRTQAILFEVVAELRNDETLIDRLENGAFLSGSDVDLVLYAGAIDIRDRIVEKVGFKIWDIDKEQTEHND